MFGAYWCPHCADQKALFGKSVKQLPYFECSVNGQQTQACNDRGITSYPTWQFDDATIKALPQTAMLNLFNSELEKTRASAKMYQESVKDKPELLKVVEAYSKKNEALVNSDISEYEKLKKLTALAEGPNGTLVENPVYNLGRIAGQRTLSDLAVLTGCTTAYEADTSTAQ